VAHPELVPSALEELLRYDTSVQFNQRVANEDVVYKGISIPENDRIIVLLGAANRDPEVFVNPDRLDIGRDPNPHLAFGAGMYHCLGIHLARMQMQIALDAMVRHMPGLRLVGEPEWRPTWMMRGLASMPVEF
jgi:cytochrome P450